MLIGPGRGVPTITDQNAVLLTGPEALHLLDDMFTVAWNTNQATVLSWFSITKPAHIFIFLAVWQGQTVFLYKANVL